MRTSHLLANYPTDQEAIDRLIYERNLLAERVNQLTEQLRRQTVSVSNLMAENARLRKALEIAFNWLERFDSTCPTHIVERIRTMARQDSTSSAGKNIENLNSQAQPASKVNATGEIHAAYCKLPSDQKASYGHACEDYGKEESQQEQQVSASAEETGGKGPGSVNPSSGSTPQEAGQSQPGSSPGPVSTTVQVTNTGNFGCPGCGGIKPLSWKYCAKCTDRQTAQTSRPHCGVCDVTHADGRECSEPETRKGDHEPS